MKFRGVAAICIVLASLSAAAQMSHEEMVVRTAYLRLSYAAEMRVVAQDAMDAPGSAHGSKSELANQIKNLVPRFKIDGFTVGGVSQLAGEPWERFVTKPSGDVIDVGVSGLSLTFNTTAGVTKKSMFYVMTGWTSRVFEQDWSSISVSQAIAEVQKLRGESYDRYASYRVQATLGARSRTYNAMFLFGRGPGGKEIIHIVDHIVGMGSLDVVGRQSLYPEALLETYYRERPEISEWITANTSSIHVEARDAYCSPSGCSLPKNWVAESLRVQINPETRRTPAKRDGATQTARTNLQPESANCSNYNTIPTFAPITTYNTAERRQVQNTVPAISPLGVVSSL